MAANKGEVEPMETTRYSCWVLLSSLLLLLTGCSRREMLDDYPVSGVQITLDWSGVTGQLPEGVRVIFYPKNAGGTKFDSYLPVKGGAMKVIPGRYSVVIYNYDTETLRVCGEESFETIEVYTGNCTGLGAQAEKLVWEPDPLYVVSMEDVKIEKSDDVLQLAYKPKLVVQSYSFQMKVAGLEYVSNVMGVVEGMANSYHLGTGAKASRGGPVLFYMKKDSEGVNGCFHVFGVPDGTITRADFQMKLTLAFIKVDNSVQTHTMDITEAVTATQPGSGGGEGETPEFSLPLEEVPVEVEKPTNPPIGGGGGVGGDVDDWGKEDEVILPAK